MTKQDEIIYPVTEETMHAYAKSIFDPIIKGECVTTVWVPMAGRRKHNRFIIENISLFNKELPNHDKYLLIYVEPLDLTEESLAGYLRLIGESLIESCKKSDNAKDKVSPDIEKLFSQADSSYSQLLDALRKALLHITQSGLEVVFFLGEFDELSFSSKIFYKNLKSLWGRLYPRLHYVFLMTRIVDSQDYYYTWDELGEVILQNVIYVPIQFGVDEDYLLNRFSKEFGVNLSKEYSKVVKDVCGGHPYSMRVAMRLIRDNFFSSISELEKALIENYELKFITTGIYERRSEKEQEVLKKVVSKEALSEEELKTRHLLVELGLIEYSQEEYRLFSNLLSQVIENVLESQISVLGQKGILSLDERTAAILYNGKTVEESFTRQEYSILTLFLKNSGKILTRDDIGAILWGDSSYEKYSDWAIDQLMSKLRKKLKEIGVNVEISTLRGRGYKFIQ